MSVSSVNSTNPYSYLQWPSQSDSSDAASASAPSDPLQSLYQAFSGGGSSDPLLAALGGAGDAPSGSASPPPFDPGTMQALLSVQSDQGDSAATKMQSLFGKFDANGDGQISQSEFETAIGSGADQSKVDALFNKIDANGDGSVSPDEMQSAMQKAHGGHHHHHHGGPQGAGGSQGGGDPLQSLLSGTSADGTTSQSATNADGSTTTTITYADGTKIDMTTPVAASDAGGSSSASNPEAPNFANLLKQLIALQAQFAAPTTSLMV